jgi:hypothetical protein
VVDDEKNKHYRYDEISPWVKAEPMHKMPTNVDASVRAKV